MGAKIGLSYAFNFIGYFKYFLRQQYQGTLPELCLRYTDDGIGSTDIPLEEPQ